MILKATHKRGLRVSKHFVNSVYLYTCMLVSSGASLHAQACFQVPAFQELCLALDPSLEARICQLTNPVYKFAEKRVPSQ